MSNVRLDSIGWTYISLIIVWSVLIVTGMTYLWINRNIPSLRMRRIPLLFAGIIPLHLYAIVCLLAYSIGPLVPCTAEFWVMSLYLPLGIALFHATNSQFFHLASRQKQFAHMSRLQDAKSMDEERTRQAASSRWKKFFVGDEKADNIERTLVFIGVGIAIQISLSLFVFFGSEKFHPGWGLFDYTVQGTAMEVRIKCGKGWEWLLSIVWQFFWAWIYAPYMLWKTRDVHDVHGWRIQTICCCAVGLPATPLWLAAVYAPQMATVSAVLPPPVWFSICIFFMEVFTIGFPIIGTIQSNGLRKETLEAIASWEKRQEQTGVAPVNDSLENPSLYSDATDLKVESTPSLNSKKSFDSIKSDMLTMTALENALRTNALPLLEFAALKDFSGENVSFLTLVADWRRYWFSPKSSTADHHRKQFIAAVRIYAHFVSLEFSEFPINISSREMKNMHRVFDRAAVAMYRNARTSLSSETSDSVTPFDNVLPDGCSDSPALSTHSGDKFDSDSDLKPAVTHLESLGRANLQAVSRLQILYTDDAFSDIEIPEGFNEMVFDAAEREIKYLILINTWPKFVNAGRVASQMSKDDDEEKGHGWMGKLLCLA